MIFKSSLPGRDSGNIRSFNAVLFILEKYDEEGAITGMVSSGVMVLSELLLKPMGGILNIWAAGTYNFIHFYRCCF